MADIYTLPGWMLWGIIAVILLVVEVMTVAYVALGLGVGAMVAGLVAWAWPELPLMVQALVWAVMGLLVWLGLSRWNRERHKRPDINDFNSLDALPPSDRRKAPGKAD